MISATQQEPLDLREVSTFWPLSLSPCKLVKADSTGVYKMPYTLYMHWPFGQLSLWNTEELEEEECVFRMMHQGLLVVKM